MRAPLIAFVLSIFSISASAQPAQRTFVSTGGLDSNACSRSAPCRNFAAAVTAVASRGEVVVLDSGGYGPVTISKEVSIISPSGVYAAITAFSGSAILVSAPASIVTIRGLTINSLGGQDGIELTDATDLHVENVVITRFTNAMNLHAGNAGADFTIRDAEIRDNDGGILINSAMATTRGSIDRSRFDENGGAAVSITGQCSVWIRVL